MLAADESGTMTWHLPIGGAHRSTPGRHAVRAASSASRFRRRHRHRRRPANRQARLDRHRRPEAPEGPRLSARRSGDRRSVGHVRGAVGTAVASVRPAYLYAGQLQDRWNRRLVRFGLDAAARRAGAALHPRHVQHRARRVRADRAGRLQGAVATGTTAGCSPSTISRCRTIRVATSNGWSGQLPGRRGARHRHRVPQPRRAGRADLAEQPSVFGLDTSRFECPPRRLRGSAEQWDAARAPGPHGENDRPFHDRAQPLPDGVVTETLEAIITAVKIDRPWRA